MKIRVDSHIKLRRDELSTSTLELIKTALTFPNQEKLQAEKEMIRGWEEMPDHVFLFSQNNGELVLPRGFIKKLEVGLKQFKIDYEIEDARGGFYCPDYFDPLEVPELRPHQERAKRAILSASQGIVEIPTGGGKTLTVLAAMREAGQRGLVLVDRINLAEQWRAEARRWLGATNVGIIGDNEWDEQDLTIALQQTLWSQRERLTDEGWWYGWGFVVLDECHRVPARTYQDVMQRFPAPLRIGVSATPEKGQKIIPVATTVLGEIIHQTMPEELQEQGITIKPYLKVVPTEFSFPYHSTFFVNKWEQCPINCGRTGAHYHRNNYQKMIGELVKDRNRNRLIAHNILENRGRANLVYSYRLNHLKALESLVAAGGWPLDRLLTLTGKETRQERIEVAKIAEKSDVVIFSSIAKEAVDIPRLDRLHLVWPQRDADGIKQLVGRIVRTSSNGKIDAIIYDYVDQNVGVLKSQFKTRNTDFYRKEGFEGEILA